jgi:transposase
MAGRATPATYADVLNKLPNGSMACVRCSTACGFLVRMGAQWRMMPHDLSPWAAVYQPTPRWLKAGVFEAIVDDLRAMLRLSQGRNQEPSAAIFDSRTLQSSPESGHRAGYDGAKRRKGSKVHPSSFCLCHGSLPIKFITDSSDQRTRETAVPPEWGVAPGSLDPPFGCLGM